MSLYEVLEYTIALLTDIINNFINGNYSGEQLTIFLHHINAALTEIVEGISGIINQLKIEIQPWDLGIEWTRNCFLDSAVFMDWSMQSEPEDKNKDDILLDIFNTLRSHESRTKLAKLPAVYAKESAERREALKSAWLKTNHNP